MSALDIRIYDNDGKTFDRYTVIYMDSPENRSGIFAAVGMSANPFHPQGFGQHTSAMPGPHLGRRIHFDELPEDCRKLAARSGRSASRSRHPCR